MLKFLLRQMPPSRLMWAKPLCQPIPQSTVRHLHNISGYPATVYSVFFRQIKCCIFPQDKMHHSVMWLHIQASCSSSGMELANSTQTPANQPVTTRAWWLEMLHCAWTMKAMCPKGGETLLGWIRITYIDGPNLAIHIYIYIYTFFNAKISHTAKAHCGLWLAIQDTDADKISIS